MVGGTVPHRNIGERTTGKLDASAMVHHFMWRAGNMPCAIFQSRDNRLANHKQSQEF